MTADLDINSRDYRDHFSMRLSEILEHATPEPLNALFVALHNHDRVKLTQPITDKDRDLPAGSTGTIIRCHDGKAYDVEFPGTRGAVQVPRGWLEKI